MTFRELQDAVLERFHSDQRTNAKAWLNLSYAQLWTAEPWTFRQTEDQPVSVVGNPLMANVPPNLGKVLDIWDARGTRLVAYDRQRFNSQYLSSVTAVAEPCAYSAAGGTIKLGPTPATAESFTLFHLRRISMLVDDLDEPELPEEYHWVLVPGAQSQGQIVKQDPNAGMSLQAWASALELLRRDYLEDQLEAVQWGRWA